MSSFKELNMIQWHQTKVKYILKKWLPISILIGISSGILMSLFLFFIQMIETVVRTFLFIPFAVILAGLVTALLVKNKFTEVEGPGIGYLIELKNKQIEIPPRTIYTRFFSSGISLGSGMPGGKEGPAFLMGGGLAYTIGKRFNLNKEDLSLAVTIGSASCTSAIFSAPLGGTLFASEVPFKRDIDMDVYLPAFIASITSVLTFFIMSTFIFDITSLHINIETNIPFIDLKWIVIVIVFGLLLGLATLIYNKLYLELSDSFNLIHLPWQKIILSSFLGAIFIWVSSLITDDPLMLETGFSFINNIANNIDSLELMPLILLFTFKAIIILFLISGGNSIGIFSPSLILGGLLGAIFAILTGLSFYIGEFFILGMAGILAGTAKTPISSMVLILEITGLPQMIFYMAIVTTIVYLASGETGLYPAQLLDRREALRQKIETKNYLAIVPISSIMTSDVVTFNPQMTIEEARKKFQETRLHTIPVVNDQNNVVVGIVSSNDLKNLDEGETLENIMITDVITLTSDLSLQQVLQLVLNSGIEHYPVIEKDTKVLEGFVTLRDILGAYLEQELAFAK